MEVYIVIDYLNSDLTRWYVALCFLYAFENNTPKDDEIIKNIHNLEIIINNKISQNVK